MSEEYLRRYQETGEVGASTLGEVVPLGETLFPKKKEAERIPKAKRGPQARRSQAESQGGGHEKGSRSA